MVLEIEGQFGSVLAADHNCLGCNIHRVISYLASYF
jgi:hypothetical protein